MIVVVGLRCVGRWLVRYDTMRTMMIHLYALSRYGTYLLRYDRYDTYDTYLHTTPPSSHIYRRSPHRNHIYISYVDIPTVGINISRIKFPSSKLLVKLPKVVDLMADR